MLQRAIVKDRSVCLSVRLSVCLSACYTRETRLHGLRYRNMFHTIRESDVSSFLPPNFIVLSLGIHPNECVTPCRRRNLTNNAQ